MLDPERLAVRDPCLKKVRAIIDNSTHASVDGMIVRKGEWICVITNRGRCEWFKANEFGGIRPTGTEQGNE